MKETVTIDFFSQVLEAYRQGAYDSDRLVRKFGELLSGADEVPEQLLSDLEDLITETHLPPQISGELLDSLVEPKTRLFRQHNEVLPPTEVNNERELRQELNANSEASQTSSLLKDLQQWNEGDQEINISANQTIRGTYRLEKKIGSGGMGVVWKAVDLIMDAGESIDKHVAIKFISHEIRSHPYALKALVREFARYKRLIHPNIVKAFELNRDESEVFIVMEFLQGDSLKQFIRQHPRGVSLKEARPIIKGMCSALDYAHSEGIVHLDFKPGNVFYDANNHLAKVIDFGIARLASQEDRDKTRFDPGKLGAVTTAYASCEMLIKEDDPAPRDDIYGLACVIYELLSGRHPFNGEIAIKAERVKMQPKPIKGLTKAENEALAKGLSFHRKDRTQSAKQIYEGLYLPQLEVQRKRSRMWIIAAIVALGVLVLPPLLYKTFDSWRMNQISESIQAQEISGINQFLDLAYADQQNLLRDFSTRLALVKFAVSNLNPTPDAVEFLRGFDPKIQSILFKDRENKQILKSHYIEKINRAVAHDEFDRALTISNSISAIYPDSKSLADQVATIKPNQTKRLYSLEKSYRRCIDDQKQSVHELLPCFQETRLALAKILPLHPLLAEPILPARFKKESSAALAKKDLSAMADLLSDWRKLIPQDTQERIQLEYALQHEKDVAAFVARVKGGSDLDMEKIIPAMETLDNTILQDVLQDNAVLKKLLNFYQNRVAGLIEQGNYPEGFDKIDEALHFFSGKTKQTNILAKLKKKTAQSKAKALKGLAKQYAAELNKETPGISSLQALHREINKIDTEHPLLQYLGVEKTYNKLIINAMDLEKFSQAQRLLDDWLILVPEDKHNKAFKALSEERNKRFQAQNTRVRLEQQLQKAIQSGQPETFKRILEELQTTLSSEDRKRVHKNLQEQLILFYQDNIRNAVKQDDFSSAEIAVQNGLAYFPESKALKAEKNQITKAKQQRIKILIAEYQETLRAEALNAQAIFSVLGKLTTIDVNYPNDNIGIYEDLKNRLLALAKTENSLPQLQLIMAQWEKFFNAMKPTEKVTAIYQDTRNLIALRCLYTGRTLKEQDKKEFADEYLMFGLSLNPINTVRNALAKDLQK